MSAPSPHLPGPLLIGVDVGTTSIKVIAFDRSGRTTAQVAAATPTYHPRPGWAYHHAEELWQTVAGLLRQLTGRLAAPDAVAGIAVTSVGEAGVMLDAAGAPVAEMIAWFDTRAEPQAQWLDQAVGARRLFAVTGLALQPIFSLCKVLWLRDHAPEAFAASVRWLNTADYIAYRLSGVQATDLSLASRTLALDVRRLSWAENLLAAVGLPADLFAPLVSSGTPLGAILPEVAAATGLPPHTCVAAGGHDHVCGALALGVTEPGMALNSIGTAEAVFLPVDGPRLADLLMGEQGFAQGLHVDGRHAYLMGGLFTSGGAIDWFRTTCAPGVDYATLIGEAEQTPPGSIGVCFLPHLRLANPPDLDPKARGALIGLSTDAPRGALFRAVLEGLAYEVRRVLTPLQGYAGADVQTVLATGGGTRNRLYMQIKAAVLNRTIQVSSIEEATALGAAVLAGLGAGVYADAAAARAEVHHELTPVAPDPTWVDFYDRLYQQVYRHFYATLRPLHHALAPLREEFTVRGAGYPSPLAVRRGRRATRTQRAEKKSR
jgi:xylulokinase